MTIKMLVPHLGTQAGARITRTRLEEDQLVAAGKASYNLGKRLSWPYDERDGGVIGLFDDTATLETAYPAARYPGFSALINTTPPYDAYLSTGSSWVPISVGEGVGAPDLSGYAFLAGRSGGQVLKGGTADDETLILQGTAGESTADADAVIVKVGVGGPILR